MSFKCKICGRFVKGENTTDKWYTEIGTCKKCNISYKIHQWHYFDETGEAVCGVDVVSCNGVV